ncbi:MAG: DNA adenine methylase [Candidatus Acidiferrales bacterium]
MRFEAPHPIPYQGSKRQLAAAILSFVPSGKYERLIEPFAGSAAITLAAAQKRIFSRYTIGDVLPPLAAIWQAILHSPQKLVEEYRGLWNSQLSNPRQRFNDIREQFNRDHNPAKLLFLLARCVKNSVRFSRNGDFNQSADMRRLGVRPGTLKKEILAAHNLLSGRCQVLCGDFRQTLLKAGPRDIVYMDPPYEGVSRGRDSRYVAGVPRDLLVGALDELNHRGVQFLLSYDGTCGEKKYGEPLPASLGLRRVLLDAGRSSQATLSGRKWKTTESLYLSPGLSESDGLPELVRRGVPAGQASLFR